MNYIIKFKQSHVNNYIIAHIHDIDESVHCGIGIIFQLHDDCYRTIYKFCENNIADFLKDNGYVTIISKDVYNEKNGNYTFQLTPKSLLEVL